MIDSDLAQFSTILDSLSEYYQRDPLSPMAVKIYFSALKKYTIESIGDAVSAHLQTPGSGSFYPKAADLALHLEGGPITTGQIVAAAQLAETPLGILARIHIGTWDLSNLDSFDLRQRAEEVLQLLPMWKERAGAGDYTNHQISIMIKYDVDPLGPFYLGLAPPADQSYLTARVDEVKGTPRHLELLQPPFEAQSSTGTDKTTQISVIARSIGHQEHSK